MKNNSVEHQLKERVKELKCLYEISRIAWDTKNDIPVVISKLLKLLPAAMQHSGITEIKITLDKTDYATEKFKKVQHTISSPLVIDKKKRGLLAIGYLKSPLIDNRHPFLPEEIKLIKTVAMELSLIIKRSFMEEDTEKLQIQLQHAERLAFVGELSAGIAHELNEPLGRVLGFAQLIKKEGLKSDQQTEDIERIIKASLYAREIIKKLMLFSRQMPQQIIATNINDIIENILYFIDVRYQGIAITIKQKLDSHLPEIQADPVQISQVIVNLITNAIHAMPKGGELLISTQAKPDHVRLSVKDTGQGMTASIRKRIFEPFFTTKAVGQGTGLGLSVVQGIIVSHKGSITVKSIPDKGSVFEILLPLTQKKHAVKRK